MAETTVDVLKYGVRMGDAFKKVADDHGIPTMVVAELYDIVLTQLMKEMSQYKPVRLPNIGTLRMDPAKTRAAIQKYIYLAKREDFEFTREKAKARTAYLWKYHTLARQHEPGTGADYRKRRRIEQNPDAWKAVGKVKPVFINGKLYAKENKDVWWQYKNLIKDPREHRKQKEQKSAE